VNKDLVLIRNKELFHHQLRPFVTIYKVNARYETGQLNTNIKPDVIFNFNYDYYWLRSIYKNIPIISVFNEDFLILAKRWMKRITKQVEGETARISDICLAVSNPILRKCLKYNKSSFLFLPWAPHLCESREHSANDQKLLYWGYISKRIDLSIIKYLCQNGIRIDMIGPTINSHQGNEDLKYFQRYGVRFLKPVSYEELSDLADSYYASVLPYRTDLGGTHSITMSNRGFKLLALGLPLICPDLPNFMDAPRDVIWKCSTKNDFLQACHTLSRARSFQGINAFLSEHLEVNRRDQLFEILKDVCEKYNIKFVPDTTIL